LALLEDQADQLSPELMELAHRVRTRRLTGPLLHVEQAGRRLLFALGERVTFGRSGSDINLPSPALSRVHLALERREGQPTLVDLSKNGTSLNGVRLGAPLALNRPVELVLGGVVPARFVPNTAYGIQVSVLGECYHAPLGDAVFEMGVIRLSHDGWLEFVPRDAPVFLNACHIVTPIQLCRGDVLSTSQTSPPELRFPT
jgi:hypothetical protein